eukprot:gene3141-13155_t
MPSQAVPNPAPPFLQKTYDIVEDPSTDDIVSWGDQGASFIVHKQAEFVQQLLPKHFKHNNFSSFVRQLNTYGFRKVDASTWKFANDNFIRGRKHLLREIHRRKSTGPAPATLTAPDNAPANVLGAERGAIEIGNFGGVREQLECLRRDKNILMTELVRLRQAQAASDQKICAMQKRLEATEQQQQTIIHFFTSAFNNPGMLQQIFAKFNNGGVKRIGPGKMTGCKKRRAHPDDTPTVDGSAVMNGPVHNSRQGQHEIMNILPGGSAAGASDSNLIPDITADLNLDLDLDPAIENLSGYIMQEPAKSSSTESIRLLPDPAQGNSPQSSCDLADILMSVAARQKGAGDCDSLNTHVDHTHASRGGPDNHDCIAFENVFEGLHLGSHHYQGLTPNVRVHEDQTSSPDLSVDPASSEGSGRTAQPAMDPTPGFDLENVASFSTASNSGSQWSNPVRKESKVDNLGTLGSLRTLPCSSSNLQTTEMGSTGAAAAPQVSPAEALSLPLSPSLPLLDLEMDLGFDLGAKRSADIPLPVDDELWTSILDGAEEDLLNLPLDILASDAFDEGEGNFLL